MPQNLRTHGIMLILSSPSGAGKSSLARALVAQDQNTHLSISATTRPPRPGEIDGKDYHFLTKENFETLVTGEDFLEHATVFQNHYGTLSKEVELYLDKGIDVIFDIDWQGATSLRKKKQKHVISIYILPPSMKVLKERLTKRCQDNTDTIVLRMKHADEEISHYHEYDYIVINDDFTKALMEIQSILNAERSNRLRMDRLEAFVKTL
jgi:guanylate kinase